MRRTALRRHTPIRQISDRRLVEMGVYRSRQKSFLLRHPFCQVWLDEHGVKEFLAVQTGGILPPATPGEPSRIVPLATQVHHMNKRRGVSLLDELYWLAVSDQAHERIETNKAWSRAQGYLLDF